MAAFLLAFPSSQPKKRSIPSSLSWLSSWIPNKAPSEITSSWIPNVPLVTTPPAQPPRKVPLGPLLDRHKFAGRAAGTAPACSPWRPTAQPPEAVGRGGVDNSLISQKVGLKIQPDSSQNTASIPRRYNQSDIQVAADIVSCKLFWWKWPSFLCTAHLAWQGISCGRKLGAWAGFITSRELKHAPEQHLVEAASFNIPTSKKMPLPECLANQCNPAVGARNVSGLNTKRCCHKTERVPKAPRLALFGVLFQQRQAICLEKASCLVCNLHHWQSSQPLGCFMCKACLATGNEPSSS